MKGTLAAWLIFALSIPALAHAQSVEVNDSNEVPGQTQESPVTGKERANGYFKSRKNEAPRATAPTVGAPHVMSISMGGFFTGTHYKWGEGDSANNAGRFNFGVTYRIGEWVNSMDLSLRMEYTSYGFNVPQGADDRNSAAKLSIGPLLTFPDASSKFPLYFGAGIGAGLFIQQVHDKSPVALDWQVIAGVRFMDVFQNLGFMLETGLKNHVLLGTEGQFNGVFVNVGTIFDF
jgi:hypothetical protein